MMNWNPEEYLGKWGYVKIDKNLYVYGEIVETGRSGAAGYYAILQFHVPKGNQTKLLLEHINELRPTLPKRATLLNKVTHTPPSFFQPLYDKIK